MTDGFALVADQFLPIRRLGPFALALCAFFMIVFPLATSFYYLWRRSRLPPISHQNTDHPHLSVRLPVLAGANALLVSVVAAYFLFIGLVQAFVNPSTPFDLRILSPVLPLLGASFALHCTLLRTLSENLPVRSRLRRLTRVAAGLVATVLVVAFIRSGRAAYEHLATRFRPPSSAMPSPDDRMTLLRELSAMAPTIPSDARLSSNTPAIVWYALRRPVLSLDPSSLEATGNRPSVVIITRSTSRLALSWDDNVALGPFPSNLDGRALHSSDRIVAIMIEPVGSDRTLPNRIPTLF